MLSKLLAEEALICPACRGWKDGRFINAPLLPGTLSADGRAGLLRCSHCSARYPVIDGVAIIMPEPGEWFRQQERSVMWRSDLTASVERWVRGAWSESADPNWNRQMLSVYARQLEQRAPSGPLASFARQHQRFHRARRAALVQEGALRVLDAGCGVGEATLALSALGATVIAVDTNFAALRLLSTLLRDGSVNVPRWRHGGNDYTTARVALPEGVNPVQIALIAADMLNPPLRARSVDAAFAYNLLDNVSRPTLLIQQLHALVRVQGALALSTPYDWKEQRTPPQERLGEAIRFQDSPDPAAALVAMLSGQLPGVAAELSMQITVEETVPWVLQRHERNAHVFWCHYVEARRLLPGGSPMKKR